MLKFWIDRRITQTSNLEQLYPVRIRVQLPEKLSRSKWWKQIPFWWKKKWKNFKTFPKSTMPLRGFCSLSQNSYSSKSQTKSSAILNWRWLPSIALHILSAHHFFAWLARAPSELDRFSMKAAQFREITGRFLLNELHDPHFLIHKIKQHMVKCNISRFQEKLKTLLWDIVI